MGLPVGSASKHVRVVIQSGDHTLELSPSMHFK